MTTTNNVLKIYENTYIKGNTDILGTIDIRNDLFTNKLKIEEKLKVHNFTYISKNLNINKNILSTNIKENPLLEIKNNIFVEEEVNSDSSLECNNIDSKNFDLYLNKKKGNYLFDNNVLIYNTTSVNNYAKLTNLFLYNDLFSKNITCINANLNIINSENVSVHNLDSKYRIDVKNDMALDGFLNLYGNINVKNNLNIKYASIQFKENSSFIIGINKFGYNLSYGLRHNPNQNIADFKRMDEDDEVSG